TRSEEDEVVGDVESEEKTGAWHKAVELAVVDVGYVLGVGIEFDVVVVFFEAGREAIEVDVGAVAAVGSAGNPADPFVGAVSFAAEGLAVEVVDIVACV